MNKTPLGQHFLKNADALALIVRALDAGPGDAVIEIGPGQGALTEPLLAGELSKLIAIEKDETLAAELRIKLSAFGFRLSIADGDALKLLPSVVASLGGAPYRIVGNIPYYITGKLLRTVGDLEPKPLMTVLMVQKEVAERLSAEPPRMNRLAAMVGAWALPQIVTRLSPADFDPPPAVDSAVIALAPKPDALISAALRAHCATAHILFQQPRQTVANNLARGYAISKDEAVRRIAALGLTGGERPGNLPISTISQIASEFSTH